MDDEDQLKEIRSNLLSILIERKLNEHELNETWIADVGHPLPLAEFNCNSIEQLVQRHFSDRIRCIRERGIVYYEFIPSADTAHIAQMVAKTKPKQTKKRSANAFPFSRASSSNNNYHRSAPVGIPKSSSIYVPPRFRPQQQQNTTSRLVQQSLPLRVVQQSMPPLRSNTVETTNDVDIVENKRRIVELIRAIGTRKITYQHLQTFYQDKYKRVLNSDELNRLFGIRQALQLFTKLFADEIDVEVGCGTQNGVIWLTLRQPATATAVSTKAAVSRPTTAQPPPIRRFEQQSLTVSLSMENTHRNVAISQVSKFVPTSHVSQSQQRMQNGSVASSSTGSTSFAPPTNNVQSSTSNRTYYPPESMGSMLNRVDNIPSLKTLSDRLVHMLTTMHPNRIVFDDLTDQIGIDPMKCYNASWSQLFKGEHFEFRFAIVNGYVTLVDARCNLPTNGNLSTFDNERRSSPIGSSHPLPTTTVVDNDIRSHRAFTAFAQLYRESYDHPVPLARAVDLLNANVSRAQALEWISGQLFMPYFAIRFVADRDRVIINAKHDCIYPGVELSSSNIVHQQPSSRSIVLPTINAVPIGQTLLTQMIDEENYDGIDTPTVRIKLTDYVDTMHFHFVLCRNLDRLGDFQQIMNDFYRPIMHNEIGRHDAILPRQHLVIGQLCVIEYDDESDLWCRARIVDIDADRTMATVRYVDIGRDVYVPTESIYQLDRRYLHLCAQAIPARFSTDYRPANGQKVFPDEFNRRIIELKSIDSLWAYIADIDINTLQYIVHFANDDEYIFEQWKDDGLIEFVPTSTMEASAIDRLSPLQINDEDDLDDVAWNDVVWNIDEAKHTNAK